MKVILQIFANMISADFLIYVGVFYVYFPFQKYLSCEDWIKKTSLSRFQNCDRLWNGNWLGIFVYSPFPC